jgi:hypothetical protein
MTQAHSLTQYAGSNHREALYFQNIIWFQGPRVNVISFMPIRKVRNPSAEFHEIENVQTALFAQLAYKFLPKVGQ